MATLKVSQHSMEFSNSFNVDLLRQATGNFVPPDLQSLAPTWTPAPAPVPSLDFDCVIDWEAPLSMTPDKEALELIHAGTDAPSTFPNLLGQCRKPADDDGGCEVEIEREGIPGMLQSSQRSSIPLKKPTVKASMTQRRDPATKRQQTICPLCSKPMLKRVLLRHLRTVHRTQGVETQSAPYKCPECHDRFFRKDILERHQAEQHGEKSGTVQCPSCNSQVRMRALNGHFKTRMCQEAQLKSDLALLQARKQSWIASLDDPGRFDGTTVIDPLFVALLLFIKDHEYRLRFKFDELLPCHARAEFLDLQGVALRTVFRALEDPTESESGSLALTLYFLNLSHRFNSWLENDPFCGILARTLHALEQRFGFTLNGHLFRPGGIARAMMIHLWAPIVPHDSQMNAIIHCLDYNWPTKDRPRILGRLQNRPKIGCEEI